MADIIIRIDGQIGARALRGGLVAALLCLGATELNSESVTLSTYYPAPSGVYTNMITTGNTYLARDSGNVGVKTAAPAYNLHVNGTFGAGQTRLTNSDVYFTDTAHSHTGIGNTAGYAAIENASNFNTLMLLGRANGIGGGRSVSVWDRLDVNGTMMTNGDAYISGARSRMELQGAGGVVVIHQSNCSVRAYTNGVDLCPAGTYASMVSGVMVKTQIIASTNETDGNMLCCPCPTGGCPSL